MVEVSVCQRAAKKPLRRNRGCVWKQEEKVSCRIGKAVLPTWG